jgi:glutaredoxin
MMRFAPALRSIGLLVALSGLSACSRDVDIGELRAEIGNAPVVLLSTSTCGYCKRLRADLRQWGVAFDDLDVESNRHGRRAYREVNGRGVPILVIGDNVLHGYSPERSRALLVAAQLLSDS